MMAALARRFVEQRGSNRAPLTGRVYYEYHDQAGVHTSAGCWRDVSRDGVCVRLGRYIAPNRFLLLETAPATGSSSAPKTQFKGRVAWCTPIENSSHFLAGIRVYRSEPEVARTIDGLAKSAGADLEERAGNPADDSDGAQEDDMAEDVSFKPWRPNLW